MSTVYLPTTPAPYQPTSPPAHPTSPTNHTNPSTHQPTIQPPTKVRGRAVELLASALGRLESVVLGLSDSVVTSLATFFCERLKVD